ncbi:MAG: hypothetical protein KF685_11510, partial [Acidobacteria bacterium]|nr:hypothetical protein [Acidobacteriota bacterium]
MKKAIIALLFFTFSGISSGQTANRTVAVTIDDLPVVSTRRDLKNRRSITKNLLGHIKKAKV